MTPWLWEQGCIDSWYTALEAELTAFLTLLQVPLLIGSIRGHLGFPSGMVIKSPPTSVGGPGDVGSIPGSGDPLEWEMATHSSILAWKILWTRGASGLQSMELQRARHDWAHPHTRQHLSITTEVGKPLFLLTSLSLLPFEMLESH